MTTHHDDVTPPQAVMRTGSAPSHSSPIICRRASRSSSAAYDDDREALPLRVRCAGCTRPQIGRHGAGNGCIVSACGHTLCTRCTVRLATAAIAGGVASGLACPGCLDMPTPLTLTELAAAGAPRSLQAKFEAACMREYFAEQQATHGACKVDCPACGAAFVLEPGQPDAPAAADLTRPIARSESGLAE